MKEDIKLLSIQFPNQAKAIPETIRTCLEVIEKALPPHPGNLLSRMKWVLAELLTNATKHSGKAESYVGIYKKDNWIIIEKMDSGKTLTFDSSVISWPPLNNQIGHTYEIYHNGMDVLKLQIQQKNQALFYVEEAPETYMPKLLCETSEHFGLLIITKSCDEFTYEFEEDIHLNIFTCAFNLSD
ncbi:hypothetical protein DYBT9275_02115 [Dyadobacter sp. CECT 9275]|uniref:Uncharacterized protein n=1 Tax=Dyadobacter helix TaxID=2822344 RepID=A0A916JAQ5_9BACT|nr:anti-sigma regulatory factor [Dyadobacter sp. CECT 9275]CAG4998948.1 hypothetical protein DYBT9275_02115 [Dyadobacter sp. CECT 9275]